jgi:hypothetical protein
MPNNDPPRPSSSFSSSSFAGIEDEGRVRGRERIVPARRPTIPDNDPPRPSSSFSSLAVIEDEGRVRGRGDEAGSTRKR